MAVPALPPTPNPRRLQPIRRKVMGSRRAGPAAVMVMGMAAGIMMAAVMAAGTMGRPADMASMVGGLGCEISLTDAPPSLPLRPGPAMLTAIIAAAIVLDQATKWLMIAVVMQPPQVIPVVPGFNLTLGFNEGASFGMLSGWMAGKPLAMAGLTAAITLIFAIMAFRSREPYERAGLALVVGGALGNIIDRLRQGAVTDFLDVYWGEWHWPTFNGADIAITLGAVCMLAAALPSRRRKEPVLDAK